MTHDISKQVKIFLAVGAALIVGTIVTVFAAGVKLGIIVGITVAIIIATVKGSLVAGYFMHLFAERKLIYAVLGLTVVFIIAMVAQQHGQRDEKHVERLKGHARPPHGEAARDAAGQ